MSPTIWAVAVAVAFLAGAFLTTLASWSPPPAARLGEQDEGWS